MIFEMSAAHLKWQQGREGPPVAPLCSGVLCVPLVQAQHSKQRALLYDLLWTPKHWSFASDSWLEQLRARAVDCPAPCTLVLPRHHHQWLSQWTWHHPLRPFSDCTFEHLKEACEAEEQGGAPRWALRSRREPLCAFK